MKRQTEATTLQAWWFSVGNIANNLIFMLITMFMMFFFTNVMGLDPVVAGTLFMVARLVDAFTDPIMGMIIDRTNLKRFGKYRGFIHFGAPLLGVVVVALFTVPNFSAGGKVLYAYIVYILYSLCWTVVQVPQLTIPIIMSNNVAKRTKYQAVFQGIGSIGAAGASALAMAIVNQSGGMTDPHAWQLTAICFAVSARMGFELSSMGVRNLDTYNPKAREETAVKAKKAAAGGKLSFKERSAFILQNVALFALLISFGTDMFANQINSQTNTYFYMYNMGGRTDLMSILGALPMPVSIAMIFLAGPIVAKFSKKRTICFCEIVGIVASLAIFLDGARHIPVLMICSCLSTIAFAVCNLMCRTALLDVASYTRVKTGVDAAGLMASSFTFANKLCQAVASFAAGWMLKLIALDTTAAVQSEGTLNALLACRSFIPIAAYVITLIAMHFYPIDKQGEADLQVALDELKQKETEVGQAAE